MVSIWKKYIHITLHLFVGVLFLSPAIADAVEYESPLKHSPYVQLGNAPLTGYDGGTDQVQIMWQTVPGAGANDDWFEVDYKEVGVGATTTIASTSVSTIDTGVGSRVNHYVDITGLDFGTDYTYAVRHVRNGSTLATYSAPYTTRLEAGDTTAFSFVAYGDSAESNPTGFRSVQDRINSSGAAFSILLGDNTYTDGTHPEWDYRLDASVNPEAAIWNKSHIDYFGWGNHDIVSDSGQPALDNYDSPRPSLGVTSPVAAPVGETPERNYSFDYGLVHFLTFDTSNAHASNSRLDNQLDWAVADLQASDQPWKVVYVHYPIISISYTSSGPTSYYYQQTVSRLRDAGADVIMAGHAHTYERSYPLTGQSGSTATVTDTDDNDYAKAVGLTEIVSGLGGRDFHNGNSSPSWLAFARTGNTSPTAEFGFNQIDVTQDELTFTQYAASDGDVIDTFTITGGLTSTNVQPETLNVDAVGTTTVSFTTSKTLPDNGKIVLTFPTSLGDGFTFNSGGSTAVATTTGMDGNFSVSISDNVVTITRSGGTNAMPGAKTIKLTNVQNPDTAGSTGVYGIKTTTSGGTTIEEESAVSADTMVVPPDPDAWWDFDYGKRIKITFDNSSQTEDLSDFPVRVSLDSNRIIYDDFKSGGDDIRFVDSDGSTVLDYEIEKWNVSGTSTLWVSVSQVDGSSAIDYVYMYYNNDNASAYEDGEAVWDSNYVMVHHFGETSGNYLDSTNNNHDSDAIAVVGRTETTGSIGNSPEFDGGDATDYVTFPDSNDFDMSNYTVEAYINSDGAGSLVSSGSGGTSLYPIVDKGIAEAENSGADVQFMFGLNASNQVTADYEGNGTSANNPVSGSTALTANGATWYHIANRVDTVADDYDVFLSGTNNGNLTRTDSPSVGGTMKVAVGAGTKTGGVIDGGFNGHVDEVRISNIARSDDWIAASALSVADSFNTYGDEEAVSAGELSSTNVEPASLTVSETGTTTVTFTTENLLPTNAKIVITFPSSLGSGFNIDSATLGSVTGIDGTFSLATSSNVITITRSADGSTSATGTKTIALGNITNPDEAGSTGTYQIKTTTNAGVTIDQDVSVSADTIVPVDATAPVISSVATSTNSTSATITWTTDEAASSQVIYGLTTDYSATTTESDTSTRVTSHSVALSDLKACSVYHFKVAGSDTLLNRSTSTDSTFTTTGCTGSASVSNQSTTAVTTGAGGSVSLSDSSQNVALTVPSGFAAGDATFQIVRMGATAFSNTAGRPNSSITLVGNMTFKLTAFTTPTTTVSSFLSPITVTMTYTDADVSNYEESSLRIYRYSGGSWNALSNCSVNTSANTVSCETSNFSDFALFGTPSSSEDDDDDNNGITGGGFLDYPIKRKKDTEVAIADTSGDSKNTSVTTPAIAFETDLQFGDINEDVRKLQQYLNAQGFTVAVSGPGSVGNETSYFGPATQKAVAALQRQYGINPPVGLFGPLTRAFVNAMNVIQQTVPVSSNGTTVPQSVTPPASVSVLTSNYTFTQNLELGDINEDVRKLQQYLNAQGFTVAVSGPGSVGNETNIFGPATQAAVIQFQKHHGITPAVGYFGPLTRGAIK